MRLALVTGASSGIGKELARQLRSQGMRVVGSGRRLEEIEGEAIYHELGILLQFIKEQEPDLIIHAAGFNIYGRAITHPLERALEMFQLHVLTILELAKALAALGQKDKKERILLVISSFAGEFPTPGMAIYGASKAAVTHLCESLDYELSAEKVRVLVCCPGMVKTPFFSRAAGRPYHYPDWVMSAETAARLILKQLRKKKGKTIIDWRYKIAGLLLPILPKALVKKVIFKRILSR